MTAIGVDIASYQGRPNWEQVKAAGYSFCWGKATQGTSYVNPEAVAQREGAVQAHIAFGHYHFAEARNANPIGEAQHFLNNVHAHPWHLVPFLDLEELGSEGASPKQIEDYAYRWGNEVRHALGVKNLVLYTDLNMLRNRIRVTQRLRNLYLLDLAFWTKGPPPKVPGWRLVVHQFDDKGHVPGISGLVDRDRCLVPLQSLTIDALKVDSPPPAVEVDRAGRLAQAIRSRL